MSEVISMHIDAIHDFATQHRPPYDVVWSIYIYIYTPPIGSTDTHLVHVRIDSIPARVSPVSHQIEHVKGRVQREFHHGWRYSILRTLACHIRHEETYSTHHTANNLVPITIQSEAITQPHG